jgi:predicted Rossmann fold nucleotide-binding protein DprA/Smf involved in DNA uptake
MSATIVNSDTRYPPRLNERLGAETPARLTMQGQVDLLALPKTALFCSARCPGSAILRAYDQAAHWREAGRCVISGFHSPVEQECLRILLRGTSPVIICPARSLPKRIPAEWKTPLAEERMLILSMFPSGESRITSALANRRNEFVAALADDVWFAHIDDGGRVKELADKLQLMGISMATTHQAR